MERDILQHHNLYITTAAILEPLNNTPNIRIALIEPHTARRLVNDIVDDGINSILSTLDNTIIIDLPLRNLLYESYNVQTIYYELENQQHEPFSKIRRKTNSLLLIDPIRITQELSIDMNSAQRQLLMRCFTPKIWIICFKLVSLGIGTKLRELYCATVTHMTSDYFLRDIESLQLELVELVLNVTKGCSRGFKVEDVENIIVKRCKNILGTVEMIKSNWKSDANKIPLLAELVPYLNKCLIQIQSVLDPSSNDNQSSIKEPNDTRRYNELNTDLLEEFCKAVVTVSYKSSTLLSLVKLKLLEERQLHLEVPGSLNELKSEYLLKGIMEASLDGDEALPLLILTHCLGAYTIREWVLRFIAERLFVIMSNHFDKLDEYGPEGSAYFRTAGVTEPNVFDYLSLLPFEVIDYLKFLINKRKQEGDDYGNNN